MLFYAILIAHRALAALSPGVVRAAVLRHPAAAGVFHSAAAGLRTLYAAGGPGAVRARCAWCALRRALGRLIAEAAGRRVAVPLPARVPRARRSGSFSPRPSCRRHRLPQLAGAPDPQDIRPTRTRRVKFPRLYPTLPHGAKLLFVHSALDDNWDMVFLLRMYYRDKDLFLTDAERAAGAAHSAR